MKGEDNKNGEVRDDHVSEGPPVDTREEIRKTLYQMKEQVVRQEEILGKPSKLLFVALLITVIVTAVMIKYLIFMIEFYANFNVLIPIPITIIILFISSFIYILLNSIGYRVTFTGREIIIRHFNKEKFRCYLTHLNFNFQEGSLQKKLVFKDNKSGKVFILTNMSFSNVNDIVERVKKIRKFLKK